MKRKNFVFVLTLLLVIAVSCDKKVDVDDVVNASSQVSNTDEMTISEDNIVYHLDIENDIMSSPGVLSREELDDCGYHFKDVSEQFGYDEAVLTYINLSEHETATIELLYTPNDKKSINVEVSEQMISAKKTTYRADITICFETCTVRVYDWGVKDSNPIELHPEVENALRTILRIESE